MTPLLQPPLLRRKPGGNRAADLYLVSGHHAAGDPHSAHLSSDQMCELLAGASHRRDSQTSNQAAQAAADAAAQAEAHLRTCAPCAAEFASLRDALALFQEASVALADRDFGRLAQSNRVGRPSLLARPATPLLPAHRPYSQTLFWVAASAILMAGILPRQLGWHDLRWQRSPSAVIAPSGRPATETRPAESDEALLEDIDRELSASVPTPMQALADPTAGASSSASDPTPGQAIAQPSSKKKD